MTAAAHVEVPIDPGVEALPPEEAASTRSGRPLNPYAVRLHETLDRIGVPEGSTEWRLAWLEGAIHVLTGGRGL